MKINAKRFVLAIVSVMLCFSLASCNFLAKRFEFKESGIENYNGHISLVETPLYMVPENFLDNFEYENAEYYYYDERPSWMVHVDRTIIICEYDEDIYTEAKNYCLDNMELLHNTAIEYNGYTFIENVKLFDHEDFPNEFNMFVYNDDKQCLIFLGFYYLNCSDDEYPDKYSSEDFIEILETYFTDYGYYDFSK